MDKQREKKLILKWANWEASQKRQCLKWALIDEQNLKSTEDPKKLSDSVYSTKRQGL